MIWVRVNFKRKIDMKKLVFLIGLSLLVSCGSGGDYKYVIYDNRGEGYLCNFYNETDDGCIMFNAQPGEDNTPGIPTIICGNYTINKLK
jgi:hypothetical protein